MHVISHTKNDFLRFWLSTFSAGRILEGLLGPCMFYISGFIRSDGIGEIHLGLFETYRYKRTGQFFIWNYIGNWYVFSKYLDNYCRYQYCANDTLFRIISSILRSSFQDILPKKDVAFCETTDTAHSYIKQIVNFSEINVSIDT